MQEVDNFLRLSASLEEVRILQAEAAEQKQQEKAATQREKDDARDQKTAAETKAAVAAAVAALESLLCRPNCTQSLSTTFVTSAWCRS